MLIYVKPTFRGPAKLRTKLGGDDLEPVVGVLIYEFILLVFVANGWLRNLAQKLRLKLPKLRRIFASFRTKRFDRSGNNIATSPSLGDPGS